MLTGFSCANEHSQRQLVQTLQESPHFASPEVISGVSFHGGLPDSVDSWNLGVVLYAMLCGRLPFIHKQMQHLCSMIMTSPFAEPSHLSNNARLLLRSLLQKLPALRISAEDSKHTPWLDGTCGASGRQAQVSATVHQEMRAMGYRNATVAEQTKPFISHPARIFFLLQQRLLREGSINQEVPHCSGLVPEMEIPEYAFDDAVVPGNDSYRAQRKRPSAAAEETDNESVKDIAPSLPRTTDAAIPQLPPPKPARGSTAPLQKCISSMGTLHCFAQTVPSVLLGHEKASKARIEQAREEMAIAESLAWVVDGSSGDIEAEATSSPADRHVHKRPRLHTTASEEDLTLAVPDDCTLP